MSKKGARFNKAKRQRRLLLFWGIVVTLIALIFIIQNYRSALTWIIVIIAMFLLLFIGRLALRYWRNRTLHSEIHGKIIEALKIMDSTRKYYADEEQANSELVSTLGALKVEATREYKLKDGRVADIKIAGSDFVIEGKLSPTAGEVDRLIGQLQGYCSIGCKVNIVIFGRLEKTARKRIEDEINDRYQKSVFLSCLDRPHRVRSHHKDKYFKLVRN